MFFREVDLIREKRIKLLKIEKNKTVNLSTD